MGFRDHIIIKEVTMIRLRGFALVVGLLVIGVLMAPLSSEAAQATVSLNDGGGEVSISLAGPACSASDTVKGFTSCWALLATPASPPITVGTWTVGNVSSTNPARLLIADKDGSGNTLDLMRLTGVTFKPVNTNGGSLTVTFSNAFTDVPNQAGSYLFGQLIAGTIIPSSGGNVVGNEVGISARGDFGSGAVDMGALDTNVWAGPTTTGSPGSFNLTSPQPFNSANCNNGSGSCTPTITQRMNLFVVGQDTLFLTSSGLGTGATCRDVGPPPSVPQGPPSPLPPLTVCKATSGKINQTVTTASNEDNKENNALGGIPFTPCSGYGCGE